MEAKKIAQILSCHIDSVTPLSGGGNSRVYKAVSRDKGDFLIKEYYPFCADWKDRLDNEFDSYSFLRENGFKNIPVPYVKDFENSLGIYSFELGESLKREKYKNTDLDPFINFISDLYKISKIESAKYLNPAKAACLKEADITEQIENRLINLLQIVADKSDPFPEQIEQMQSFLDSEFTPLFKEIKEWRHTKLQLCGCSDYLLSEDQCTLSPSDFGFHNAIKRLNGDYVFVDFEYFGIDDPAKMVADFLLHPAMNLSNKNRQYFFHKIVPLFDKKFLKRFKILLPLVDMKWCMIFLNEFIPHGFARRAHAASAELSFSKVRQDQLNKVINRFNKIKSGYEDYLNVITRN